MATQHIYVTHQTAQAALLGNQEDPRLALSSAHVRLERVLADRPNSVVHAATLEGRPVAHKRPKIGTSQDLDALKKEVQLMGCVSHPNIARLLGARLLPPGKVPPPSCACLPLCSRRCNAQYHHQQQQGRSLYA